MHLERVRERNNLKRTGQCVASRSSDSRSNFPNTRYPPGTRENLSPQLTHSKAVENWRRGWDSNPVALLIRRKLLIFRDAPTTPAAGTARIGYSLGTVGVLATRGEIVRRALAKYLKKRSRS